MFYCNLSSTNLFTLTFHIIPWFKSNKLCKEGTSMQDKFCCSGVVKKSQGYQFRSKLTLNIVLKCDGACSILSAKIWQVYHNPILTLSYFITKLLIFKCTLVYAVDRSLNYLYTLRQCFV